MELRLRPQSLAPKRPGPMSLALCDQERKWAKTKLPLPTIAGASEWDSLLVDQAQLQPAGRLFPDWLHFRAVVTLIAEGTKRYVLSTPCSVHAAWDGVFSFPIFSFFLVAIACSFLALKSFSSRLNCNWESPLISCWKGVTGPSFSVLESWKKQRHCRLCSLLSAGHQLRGSCSLLLP